MKNIKKILSCILICSICFNFIGCKKSSDKVEEKTGLKEINICTNLEDRDNVYLINYIKNQYESINTKYRVNIINFTELKEVITILNEKKVDLIFSDRNNMIQLADKGFLGEMSSIIKEEKIKDRYYDILSNYGTNNNGTYGVGILPFSVEMLYNRNVVDKMKISYPKDINDVFVLFKQLNSKGIEIPVILPEDTEINEVLFSTIFNNIVIENNIDEFYGSSDKYYKDSKSIQKVFEYVNFLYKNNILNNKTFKRISSDNLKEMQGKEYPLIIAAYNGKGLNKFEEIYKYELIDLGKNNFRNTIIVEPIVCANTTSLDKEEVRNFIKFIYSEDLQKKISQQGFYTGNIKVNKNITESTEKVFLEHIKYSNRRNMLVNNSIPEEINRSIEKIITKILSGNYTGDEWKEVVKSTYK
ncbi:ABC transporter substrate-binding protein [Haloimpatiens massiliensis]|uniref:ABC transporter substrate-binding protein n=1 Tax=Haloimpatiens massiliensis TaxID=1658110 RepID=UPI000C83891D|nr:ABC transporter substrate-binding protein [Haloimpatiens massiliensis]